MIQFRKKTLLFLLCIALVSAAQAVAREKAPGPVSNPAFSPDFYWKFATLAPKGVGWANHINDLVIPAINRATKGRLAVKVFWGGVLGDEIQYVEKIQAHRLDGAGLSGRGSLFAIPEMSVMSLPFLFQDYQEVDYVRQHLRPAFNEVAQKNGYFLAVWGDQDFDQIYSSRKPVAELDDFHGVKFHNWFGAMEARVLDLLEAKSIPLNVSEFSEALRDGRTRASISPAAWIVGTQLHSVVRYITPANIRYSPMTIIVRKEIWQSLPRDFEIKYLELMPDMEKQFNDRVREDNRKNMDAMILYGVQRVDMTPETMKKLQTITRPVWKEMAGRMYPQTLLDQVLAHLETFRSQKQETGQYRHNKIEPEAKKNRNQTINVNPGH